MSSIFCYFCRLNLFFFIAQCVFLLIKQKGFATTLELPPPVLLECCLSFYAQLYLYIPLTIIQTLSTHYLKKHHPTWHVLHIQSWLGFGTIVILFSINLYFFPLSQYSRLIAPYGVSYTILMILSLLVLSLGLWFIRPLTYIVLSLISLALFTRSERPHVPAAKHTDNIIIIGIDSLPPRPEYLKAMPMLSRILAQQVWFKETISPLARTYPAWCTILSGLYPWHHGGRYNLIENHRPGRESIAWLLQAQGFQTVFATDDRRFSLIDETFGFQHILGPKAGVNDFLLGSFNDFLLGNVWINTPFGKSFFPYNTYNRASYFSYYPQTFEHQLLRSLDQLPKTQSLFLAVHFTLPHWPYAFASSRTPEAYQLYRIQDKQALYRTALAKTDQQISTLITYLKKTHRLDHALFIVLSDHGETFYTPHSRKISRKHYQGQQPSLLPYYFKNYTDTDFDKSAGHGSDLLSPDQYHSLLALQIYKHQHPILEKTSVQTRVGLLDIAPTILNYRHSPHTSHDGIALLPYLMHHQPLPQRFFILESGMLPNLFFSQRRTQQLGQTLFHVNSEGRLVLRQEQMSYLDHMKLYAILKDDWILALYPQDDVYLTIIQQLSTGHWVDHIKHPFAQQAKASTLLAELSSFYHRDWPIKQ